MVGKFSHFPCEMSPQEFPSKKKRKIEVTLKVEFLLP